MSPYANVISERQIEIPAGAVMLEGDLVLPADATAVVLFAHGSGSSRHSPRNREVASVLHEAGLGTLLMDLLTPDEEKEDQISGHLRFDIQLLADRLLAATERLVYEPATTSMNIGYFGASTGAGAALISAARHPARLRAVVSRGGRPDLAGHNLSLVLVPTLLIVGERDQEVVRLNKQALAELKCEKRMEIVPGATHLFEEPGTLARVSDLACEWFVTHLGEVDP